MDYFDLFDYYAQIEECSDFYDSSIDDADEQCYYDEVAQYED